MTGGKHMGDKGYFVEPTVLVNTNEDMKVVQEEIFGPVVAAMPFHNAEEILSRQRHHLRACGRRLDAQYQQGHTTLRRHCAPAPSGSTATTSSTRLCPSAATKSPAGDARWDTTPSTPTPKPNPSV